MLTEAVCSFGTVSEVTLTLFRGACTPIQTFNLQARLAVDESILVRSLLSPLYFRLKASAVEGSGVVFLWGLRASGQARLLMTWLHNCRFK